jgi:hypothetical protein
MSWRPQSLSLQSNQDQVWCQLFLWHCENLTRSIVCIFHDGIWDRHRHSGSFARHREVQHLDLIGVVMSLIDRSIRFGLLNSFLFLFQLNEIIHFSRNEHSILAATVIVLFIIMYGPASHSQEPWFSIYGRLSQQSSSDTRMSAHDNTDSSSSRQLHNGIVAITAQWCCRDDYISFLSRQLHLVLVAITTFCHCRDSIF